MARARSLKPGFFTNEDLIELPFEYRLLFAGLWTLADREGRLEDRPKRIKLHIFPGDDVDIDAGLSALASRNFIIRYEAGGVRYIQVVTWGKHQSPHMKETASTIPAPDEHRASTSVAALIPSSLTPDSPFSDSLPPHSSGEGGARNAGSRETSTRKPTPDEKVEDAAAEYENFQRVKAAYPKFSGRQDWIQAQHECSLRIDEGATWMELIASAERYAAYNRALGKEGTQFVKRPGQYFAGRNDDACWRQDWKPPDLTPAVNLSPGEIVARAYEAKRNGSRVVAEQTGSNGGGVEEPVRRVWPALPA